MEKDDLIDGGISDWAEKFGIPYEFLRREIRKLGIKPIKKIGKKEIYGLLDWNSGIEETIKKYKENGRTTITKRLEDCEVKIQKLQTDMEIAKKLIKLLSEKKS